MENKDSPKTGEFPQMEISTQRVFPQKDESCPKVELPQLLPYCTKKEQKPKE